MKRMQTSFTTLTLCIVIFAQNVKSESQTQSSVPPPIYNVSYGPDSAQILDYYLPKSSPLNTTTRVVILIHGGAWGGGQKSDMVGFVPFLRDAFPSYLIVNMEYRLGTWSSPGYPKQPEDIGSVIRFIKSQLPGQNPKFALFGTSAGAHLSLLYGYRYDQKEKDVGVVIDVVGPTDFTDPAYAWNPVYNVIIFPFVGPIFYWMNPRLYNETSPVIYAKRDSPKTIGFYGNADPLVPSSQVKILRGRLEGLGVPNQFTVYNGGHGDWALNDARDMKNKIVTFLNKHF